MCLLELAHLSDICFQLIFYLFTDYCEVGGLYGYCSVLGVRDVLTENEREEYVYVQGDNS